MPTDPHVKLTHIMHSYLSANIYTANFIAGYLKQDGRRSNILDYSMQHSETYADSGIIINNPKKKVSTALRPSGIPFFIMQQANCNGY